jgi:DNA-binding SARP family transcriptional activator
MLLPRKGALLRLDESVTTDVDHFVALASSAQEPQWLEAMRLIRGSPFSGLRHSDWAVLDGAQAWVEHLITDVALRRAEALVSQRRPNDAEWVVRRALLACPYDERLYRMLLRATEAQGARARLHSTMAQLVKLAGEAEELVSPSASGLRTDRSCALHPDTRSLYQQLLAAGPATG